LRWSWFAERERKSSRIEGFSATFRYNRREHEYCRIRSPRPLIRNLAFSAMKCRIPYSLMFGLVLAGLAGIVGLTRAARIVQRSWRIQEIEKLGGKVAFQDLRYRATEPGSWEGWHRGVQ